MKDSQEKVDIFVQKYCENINLFSAINISYQIIQSDQYDVYDCSLACRLATSFSMTASSLASLATTSPSEDWHLASTTALAESRMSRRT